VLQKKIEYSKEKESILFLYQYMFNDFSYQIWAAKFPHSFYLKLRTVKGMSSGFKLLFKLRLTSISKKITYSIWRKD
jgi:hypothetical protein